MLIKISETKVKPKGIETCGKLDGKPHVHAIINHAKKPPLNQQSNKTKREPCVYS
jgi:hypothetical protein